MQLNKFKCLLKTESCFQEKINEHEHHTALTEAEEAIASWKRLRPNKDANLHCRRFGGADCFPGRPWDWDKYCRVIESLRLFPVGGTGQNIPAWTQLLWDTGILFLQYTLILWKKTYLSRIQTIKIRPSCLFPQREMRGLAPSSPPLLHKPAPSCQICLKFGCVKPRVQGQQRKWLLQTHNLR